MAVPTRAVGQDLERHDIQGLLASGYGHLPEAGFLLLHMTDPARAREWLARLADEITTAQGKSPGTAVNVALGLSSLDKLGVPRDVLDGFSERFLEGMTARHRRRALGDVGRDAPENWVWGGPNTPPVDVVLLLYADRQDTLAALEEHLVGEPARNGLGVLRRLDTRLHDREHFGFRDGIAQPLVEGLRSGPPAETIKAGEFVLGYRNEYGQLTGRPLIGHADDPARILPLDPRSGRGDLGRNGSYLVFRQLGQDVAGFWRFLDQVTTGGDGRSDPHGRTRLAAKMVGRWPDGAPLVLAPHSPDEAADDANDFGYHHTDPDGVRCPLGAHIRRARPRDLLDPDPGSPQSLEVDRRRRILRRGRGYGQPLTAESALQGDSGDDERGLHFISLCANITRQFEFVQQSWLNNPKFSGLYEGPDPLTGPAGRTFTVQAEPVRRRVKELPSFVDVRGGGYFFLPGIRAIRYLATLTPETP